MSADLRWVASLVDGISGPAKGAVKGFKDLQGGVADADQAIKDFAGGRLAKIGDALTKQIGPAAKVAGKAIAGFAVSAAASFAAAGAAVAAFGVHHTMAAESAHFALTAIVGDAGKAKAALSDIKALSNFWGADPRKLEEQFSKLVARGYDAADALKMIQASGDLGAMGNDGQKLVDVLSEIRAKGKLEAGSLDALSSQAGIDPKKLRANLAAELGSSATGVQLQKQIELALQAGTLDVAKVQSAALKTITQMTGMALGGLAEKSGHTIGGLVDNLKSVPDRLFDAANSSGAVEPLRKALESLTGALNPETATGKALAAAIGRVATAAGNVITTFVGDGAGIATFVEGLATALETVGDVIGWVTSIGSGFLEEFLTGLDAVLGPMKSFGGGALTTEKVVAALAATFKFLGAALGITLGLAVRVVSFFVEAITPLVEGLVWLGGAVGDFVAWSGGLWWDWVSFVGSTLWSVVTYFPKLIAKFFSFGWDIVAGIWDGIKGNWSNLKTKWNGLVDELPDAVASKLKINSPSKVMAELGGWSVEGFLGPVEGAAARADKAGALLAGSVAGGASSTSTSTTNNGGALAVNVNVYGAGQGGDELGQTVGAEILRALAGVRLELGAA